MCGGESRGRQCGGLEEEEGKVGEVRLSVVATWEMWGMWGLG